MAVNKIVKVSHVLLSGETRSSMEGYAIPYNETTAAAYELLAKRVVNSEPL